MFDGDAKEPDVNSIARKQGAVAIVADNRRAWPRSWRSGVAVVE